MCWLCRAQLRFDVHFAVTPEDRHIHRTAADSRATLLCTVLAGSLLQTVRCLSPRSFCLPLIPAANCFQTSLLAAVAAASTTTFFLCLLSWFFSTTIYTRYIVLQHTNNKECPRPWRRRTARTLKKNNTRIWCVVVARLLLFCVVVAMIYEHYYY